MNKKTVIMGLLGVFMLVAISYATAVDTSGTVEKKESPLFSIRTRRAISENIVKIVENIKTKLLGERAFFLPFQELLKISYDPDDFDTQQQSCTWDGHIGCPYTRFFYPSCMICK